MTITDPVAPEALTAPAGLTLTPAAISGWGGGPRAAVTVASHGNAAVLRRSLAGADPALALALHGGAIARGMGRSYGDAAVRSGGLVIETTALRAIELDAQAGEVTAQAGATLGELLAASAPLGWTLPTVPGTQHVSVGGAIASDVHGKNHGSVGSLGAHVRALGLLTADGEVAELTPDSGGELLQATIGGMGLTGVILWARIALRPLTNPRLAVDVERVGSLDQALEALERPGGSHRVAWLDLLGSEPVRGVVTRAEHLDTPDLDGAADLVTVRARAGLRPRWPGVLLQTPVVAAHNTLRLLASRPAEGHI